MVKMAMDLLLYMKIVTFKVRINYIQRTWNWMRSLHSRVLLRTLSHGTTVGKNQNQNRGQDPDHEVIPGPDPDQGVILTAVQADPDPGGLQDLEEDLEVDPDPIHQIYQSDEALHHFWKKEELQVQENDPYHTDVKDSVTKVPHPRVLTVHTPDQVDLIQDPRAQDPVQVHMNEISGFHGQEVGAGPQLKHHENDSSQFLVIMSF